MQHYFLKHVLKKIVHMLCVITILNDQHMCRAVARGGLWGLQPSQCLAEQLTLSQPGGQIMPTTVLQAPPNFQTLRRPCTHYISTKKMFLQVSYQTHPPNHEVLMLDQDFSPFLETNRKCTTGLDTTFFLLMWSLE